MASYKAFLDTNDKAIASFQDGVAVRVEGLLKAQSEVGDQVTDAQWATYEAAKRNLIGTLNDVGLCILRKVPKIQNEDTLGHEVQTAVVTELGKARAKLAGSDKEDSSIASHSAFLAGLAALHKDKKDRPESYPAELDDQRLAALQSHHAFLVKNAYATMTTIAVNVSTLLKANEELIARPKRSFNSMSM